MSASNRIETKCPHLALIHSACINATFVVIPKNLNIHTYVCIYTIHTNTNALIQDES
jgi:hypothetical protein